MVADWFNFMIYAIQQIISLLGGITLDLGFSVLEFMIAACVIGIVIHALLLRVGGSQNDFASASRSVNASGGSGHASDHGAS